MNYFRGNMPSRFFYYTLALVVLQFLIAFAQGQGPGDTVCGTAVNEEKFTVSENRPPNTLVGTITTQTSYTYAFKEAQPLFFLNSTSGDIRTRVEIDREEIASNPIHILVIRILSGSTQECPIEVSITVQDENDNSPVFQPPSVQIQFNEKVLVGYQVPLDTATDKDNGTNGTITNYNIHFGTDSADRKFTLIQIGNIPYIRTIDKLNREEKDSYQFNISCQDNGAIPRFGFLQVNIVITDYNDNSPQFNPSQFVASINASIPNNTLVIKVEATDADIGLNGDITYRFIDKSDKFTINSKTGEIRTKTTPVICSRKCERSTDNSCHPNSCLLTIEVEDGGRPSLKGRAYVTINIKDENNNSPDMKISYRPTTNTEYSTVDENAANFTVVATVSVLDKDEGNYGQISSLKIVSGNSLGHFTLHSFFKFSHNLVVVNGKNVLDRERTSLYNLTLMAADGGTPPRTSLTNLVILVKDVNDHHPMFERREYLVSLSELTHVGSYVIDLVAIDLDTGVNAKLNYAIISGNNFDWFKISPDSGLITTKARLHYDISSQVVMNVSVHDGSLDPFYNYTTLIINIWDENDITPTFEHGIYNVSISEGQNASMEIVTLKAVDHDNELNGTVSYFLHQDVNKKYPDTFHINQNTGRLQTRQVLDREKIAQYVVKVIARDGGKQPLSSTATVSISVLDINDNKPAFYPETYYASVLENMPEGTSVTTVTAIDIDEGDNGKITYYFTSSSSKFNINPNTGVIKTSKVLNRESRSAYTLRIQARDNDPTHTAPVQAVVQVTVSDQIDNVPVFKNTPYNFIVREDGDGSPPSLGRTVGTVRAVSVDSNAVISYMIADGDPNRIFTINQGSGMITTRNKVDREIMNQYTLKVMAKAGSMFSKVDVKVTIDDVNDNKPTFATFTIETYVIENWPIGHDIYLAKATDADSGVNAVVSYNLQTTSNFFGMNESTGMIYLVKPIDQSSLRDFNMVVTATDSGTPQLSSTVNVRVTVQDVNDHTPVFEHSNYEKLLNESMPVNNVFFQLTATDPDLGRNGEISYNITFGNADGKFGIFPDGKIYIAKKLDRETRDHYKLTIMAKDGAVEPRSSSANITVSIQDDNDNKPMFINASYIFYVLENMSGGNVVGTVKAADSDIGRNAELSYYLNQSSDNFTINIQTGEIINARPFDREEIANYTFPVTVMDNGLRRLSDSVPVTVHIMDINDNAPSFKENLYTASLKEDAPKYTPVIKLVATDLDKGENAALSYMFVSGNDDDQFEINSGNGQITLNKALDRENQESYIIVVRTSDSGKPIYTATTTVSINIVDVNDNAPLFAQTAYEIQVLETRQPGDLIGAVTATDTDLGQNAAVRYTLSGIDNDGTFSLDQNTGKLYLNKNLDFEVKHLYLLNISAEDKGLQPLSQYVRLTIRIADTNDNAPHFVNTPSNIVVPEDLKLISNVMRISASDPDDGQNGELIYSVKNQDPAGDYFSIKRDTGEIYLSRQLDREIVPSFKLTVVASDKAEVLSSRKSSEMEIQIQISDVNDNDPKFKSMDAIVIGYPTSQGLISTVVAEDPDFGPNGTIAYELTPGSPYFGLDSTGKLYLQQNLPQSPVTYSLKVTARDSGIPTPRSTSMTITVILMSATGGPTFLDEPYRGQVQENVNSGHSILRVKTASTLNSQEYYITEIVSAKSSYAKHFQINKSSGVISTLDVLDRELHGDSFRLKVCALERQGGSPKARTTEVNINVTDVNDTPPKFSQSVYLVNVLENITAGDEVARVTVTDDDLIGSLSLNIVQGNDGKFSINQNGIVTTSKSLDRETNASYDLKIQAFDGVNSSQCTVSVHITDVNDEVPTFTRAIYTFDLEEDMAIGTTINRVEAVDNDLGANGKVTYTLVSKWAHDVFRLDSKQGIFTLNKSLDFEQVQLYILKVKASDGGDPSLSSTVTVYMNVKDINDNIPTFDPSSYSAKVSENVTIGTSVLTVSATDRDSGANSQVKYSIIKGDQKQQFSIDPDTGVVTNIKSLDREDIPFYILEVMATDQAEPPSARHSASTQISLILEDVNDNDPEFVSPSEIWIKENTPINDLAFYVRADDKDSGTNRLLSYTMQFDSSSPFRIGRVNGEMYVNKALDRETKSQYTLVVTATDNGSPARSAVQTLKVHIQDVNDNSPVFFKQEYQATVQENVAIGKTLLTVKAEDADEGLNGLVRYFIIGGEDNSDFSVDQSSGVLRVKKSLDYERKKSYEFTIQAEDSGAVTQYSTTNIKITVTDINDNAPVFLDSPYEVYVMENLNNLPVRVTQVSARDDDSHPYNNVAYSFLDGKDENIFQINEGTGEITCHKILDREANDRYTLVIRGKDVGHPGPLLTGTGTVVVTVADVNDNAPIFEHKGVYVGHIKENQEPNQVILTVKATDLDAGSNAQITYRLEDSINNKFTIHPNTGKIVAQQRLDREETDQSGKVLDKYDLRVIASDRGSHPKETDAMVTIYVDDENDNNPKFEKQSYSQTINNPTQSGEFVIGVTALDRDTGVNGQVEYTLSGTHANKFTMDKTTGIITANQVMSTGGATYTCQVTASDKGTSPKSSEVTLVVTVSSSSSSNKPVFSNTPSTLQITENISTGKQIAKVTASSPVSSSIRFNIVGGNVGQGFAIGASSGALTVANEIDYEMTTDFQLWIEARDSQNPPQSSTVKIDVSVADENDNTPRFALPLYLSTISENQPKVTSIIKVVAVDPDSGDNGKMTFTIQSGDPNNNFTIDSDTGLISTRTELDREKTDVFNLIVQAVDHGTTTRTGSTTVKVTVRDLNDNPPKFNRQFSAEINEDTEVGRFVIQVTTSDADIGIHANVTYSLTHDKFAIDQYSGNISVKNPLDVESMEGQNMYLLSVRATDGSYANDGTVTIFIKDVNDEKPEFLKNSLSFQFPERQKIGSPIGTVTANDKDVSAPNNKVYYTLKYPSKEIEINARNGNMQSKIEMVYVQNATDRYLSNLLEVVVIATDFGTPPLSSEAVVKIHILDANDHAPVFEKDTYFSAVPSTVQYGDVILKVVAKDDHDVGVNAEIDYYMAGGNGSRYFNVDKRTGYITVGAQLGAAQQNQVYIVNIRAQDRGTPSMNTTVEVKLQITDVNRYAPEFVTTVFKTTIDEDTKIGTEIATISAVDKDQDGPNGRVSYHIVGGNDQNLFYINSLNGALSVKNGLDYETTKVHYLNISVKDTGLLYKEISAIYTITLTDVNDNPPLFQQKDYVAFIPENAASGDKVIQVTAEDADMGSNAVISYSLVTTMMFSIEPATGIIRLQGALDYETKSSYTVLVMAINPGTQQKSTTNVKIQVTGVNEFYPVFVQKEYSFSIKESAKENDPVGSVLATDQDQGEDSIVYYYLVGSSNTFGFKINYETGLITVSGKPDYESSPIIKLNVLAKNWGSVQGNDTNQCIVTISVQDANDAPVFTKALYTASVMENSVGDVSVITVSATDNDHKPSDKQFSFTILGGNVNDAFKVHAVSGLIETSGMGLLDRETQPLYNLTVGAVDTGSPPQTGSALVQISLGDVNDNAPYFQPAMPSGEVLENSDPGASVMTLSAFTYDLDLPPNKGPYTYQSHAGVHNSFFSVSQTTGLVQTRVAIDREKNRDFIVPVIVVDNGLQKKSATLTFQVIIQDVNDEPPTARNLTVQVAVLNEKYPTTTIANVKPKDKDVIGDYRCSIHGEDYGKFEIVSGCDLRIKSTTTAARSYTLGILGSDGGQGSPSVSYNIDVSFVSITNDTLDNTVILRIKNLSPAEFVALKYKSLKAAIEGLFSSDHVAVIYHTGADKSDVLVYVAVQTSSSNYIVPDILKEQITLNKDSIQSSVQITMSEIGFSVCTPTACGSGKGGECVSKFTVLDSLTIADSTALIVTSPEFRLEYHCNCYPEFSGDDCSVPVSPCGSKYCKNGGKCVSNSQGNKICQCLSGWQGDFCDIDIKECDDKSFCKNNATCENKEGSFICHCREGFSGMKCEIGSDNCRPDPCKNGGTCRNEAFDYRCECPFTFWGKSCETTTVGFEEGSYMEFGHISSQYNDINVTFATNKDNALLLYNPSEGSSDFMALEIVNGFIRFSYRLDSTASTGITVQKKVSTGGWFRVVVNRNREKATVKVSACPGDGSACDECRVSDNTCYGEGMQNSATLDLGNHRLSIGGVKNISTITSRPGQVVTHDFIGCIRQFLVNTVDLVRRQPLDQSKISSRCPRHQGQSKCSPSICNNAGTCVDEWSKARCICKDGFTGPFCQMEYKPIGFGANSFVLFTTKESYYRDQLVSQSTTRRRRDAGHSSIFIRFRTTASMGLLYYAAQDISTYAVLWINQGQLQFSIRTSSGMETMESGIKVSDGNWYNVTVTVTGKTVSLTVDSKTKDNQMMLAFEFSDPNVQVMALGGYPVQVVIADNSLQGFDGCISKFKLDDSSLPLNGSTDRFIVEPTSGVENGCSSLCRGNPCGSSGMCTVSGEEIKCSPVRGSDQEDLGIGIGVIVVIAFFGVLILVIVVVFVICYVRRRKQLKKNSGSSVKLNGSLHSNSKHNGNNSGHSHPDSGYGEHAIEEDFINTHITSQLHGHKHTNGQLNKPDIISSDQRLRKPLPLEMDDGTIIIDNGDAMPMHPMNEDTTEFYDIDATSSIAPSECIDVSTYYKGYRDGKSYNPHQHLHNNYSQHHKPHHKNLKHRESPSTVTGRNSVPLRDSPALRVSNSPADPALLLHHGSARASPMVHGARQSPMNNLLARQSPYVRASPLTHSARGTPHSDSVHHSRTNSEHSLASHHSCSSNSSVPRTAIVSNGLIKHGHRDRNRTGHSNKLKPQPRSVKGLTVEEVDKLNARPQRPSPESLVEAVSSSSGGQGRNRIPVDSYAQHGMLEPPDSSSEESANDSFTCSEFEYENDRSRTDFDSSAMIFTQVPEVDENDDYSHHQNNNRKINSDGRNSNGDSFGSSEDGHSIGVKQFNGALNWDDLLNWGPKFEKLVGVFRDIASLPDGDSPGQTHLVDTKNEGEEEYV